LDLGARLQQAPMDVLEAGRMPVIADPTGAVLGLWQPRGHQGAELAGEPGALCWNELQTHDPNGAQRFYAGLFGWGAETRPHSLGGTYTVFSDGGRPVGGMILETAVDRFGVRVSH
jgi:predicted enzyme related to lactoylglutathione lyase